MEKNRTLRWLQNLLFGAIGLLAALAVYVSALVSEQQTALQQAAHYDVAFSAGQAASEYFRLLTSLDAVKHGNTQEARDEAYLRYEILFSRHESLVSGRFLAFITKAPDSQTAVRALREALDTIEPFMARLENPKTLAQTREHIKVLEPLIVGLASSANNFGAGLVAASQSKLINLHLIFTAVTAALIATGLLLIAILLFSKRLLRKIYLELQSTTNDLEVQSGNLQRQNMLFDAALNNMSQGLCMFGPNSELIVLNRQFGEMFNLPNIKAGDGTSVKDVIDLCVKKGIASPDRLNVIFGKPDGPECDPDGAIEYLLDGRFLSVDRQHIDDGGWVITQNDVTERRKASERLAYLARFDKLTGLANRNNFVEHVERAINILRGAGEPSAVICFDIDRFKNVNDTLGHRFGDLLLQKVAERTKNLARELDLVARFGGDEFAVLLSGVASIDRVICFAQALIESLTETHDIEGHRVIVGVSVGIALIKTDMDSAETIIRNADTALYKAKAAGGNDYQFFDSGMEIRLQERLSLEIDLWNAFEREEFEVYYQPQINLLNCSINGVEALLRWKHPKRGFVSPQELIPVAEEIGLIEALGAWVLKKACSDAVGWPQKIKVAVNLSSVQFVRGDLIKTISSVLEVTGLPPEQLELELTESLFMQDNTAVSKLLNTLRDMKIRIALDDFGTGYSSLSYIRRFPIDKIKIDKSFIMDMAFDPEALAIVRTVTTLGHALDISTTAEGIETVEQMRLLHLAGCVEGQGYLFAKPLRAEQIVALLEEPESLRVTVGG